MGIIVSQSISVGGTSQVTKTGIAHRRGLSGQTCSRAHRYALRASIAPRSPTSFMSKTPRPPVSRPTCRIAPAIQSAPAWYCSV